MIWREKRVLLIILGVLLAANTIFFFTYRVQYQSRLEALDARHEQVRLQLEAAQRARRGAEQQLAAYRKIESDVQQVLNERWSTQTQRLTALIREVNRLALTANLPPPNRSYARTEPQRNRSEAGTGATEVRMTFSVQGSYQQIRRLINMLELSNQFVIIDRLDLSSADGERLTMNVQVKTLFRDTSTPAATARSQQL